MSDPPSSPPGPDDIDIDMILGAAEDLELAGQIYLPKHLRRLVMELAELRADKAFWELMTTSERAERAEAGLVALRKYLIHGEFCPKFPNDPRYVCGCGLDELLAPPTRETA